MPAPKKSVTAGYRSFKTQWTQCKLQSCSCNAGDAHDHVLVVIEICLLSRDKDEDEGVPCESEFEKKVWDAKVRGLKGKILAGTDMGSDFWKFYRNCVRFCDLTMTFFQRSEQPASSKWLQSLHLIVFCIIIFLSLLGAVTVQGCTEHGCIIRFH